MQVYSAEKLSMFSRPTQSLVALVWNPDGTCQLLSEGLFAKNIRKHWIEVPLKIVFPGYLVAFVLGLSSSLFPIDWLDQKRTIDSFGLRVAAALENI